MKNIDDYNTNCEYTHRPTKFMTGTVWLGNAGWLHRPAKKFPRINFQYSVNFSPAEYKYECLFFPSRLDFPKKIWQRSKNQQNMLFLDCVYAEVN